jgi:tetratricopeptide (TPR) repeat protein
MEIAVQCLTDADKWGIKSILPEIYIIIGNLHKETSNYKMAFEAGEKGLSWSIANKDTAEIIALLGLKAMFTHSFWLFNNDKTKPDSSIKLQFAALQMAESNAKYERLRTRFYDNIAQYYLDNKDYDKAVLYANKGAKLATKYDQQRSLTYGYCWLGQALYFKGDKPKGLDYMKKALSISQTLKEPYREMEIYGHMNDCYYSSGNYKEAIDMQGKSEHIKDSLQLSMNQKQISELQIKYESAKKDKAILLLGHNDTVKNRLIIAVLGGSMLFIAFSVILFLQYRVISRNNKIITKSNEKKNKALQNIAHIQAHELRKPLASIMGLVNVIKISEYEFDKELISKLDESAKDLDEKIHNVLSQIDKEHQ